MAKEKKQLKQLSDEELEKVTGGNIQNILERIKCRERPCNQGEIPTDDCPCHKGGLLGSEN